MATYTLNVSIPKEQAEFLEENPEISPSKVFQAKISEFMELKMDSKTVTAELRAGNKRLQEQRDKAIEFIDRKGLFQEFVKL